MSIKNPIAWFEIYVDDMSRAKLFYENVFAVVLEKIDDPTDVNSMMEMLAFPSNMEDYGAAGAIVKWMDILQVVKELLFTSIAMIALMKNLESLPQAVTLHKLKCL